MDTGLRSNKKTFFSCMGISIIVRPSYLYNENPYTGKTTSLYWDNPRVMALLREDINQTDRVLHYQYGAE